jgi:hypothetical protein
MELGFCSCLTMRWDKPCHPRGALGTGGDRLCCAHRVMSAVTCKMEGVCEAVTGGLTTHNRARLSVTGATSYI